MGVSGVLGFPAGVSGTPVQTVRFGMNPHQMHGSPRSSSSPRGVSLTSGSSCGTSAATLLALALGTCSRGRAEAP